ncbi:MAG TPA: FxsA family protein [Paracoccus sp. (in: a-proteobacteria)]|nr:FxsA family protein [Paracoccus sp. (in: a-proteobacteria)]
MWLLIPFVVLPIVEIALFIQVGGLIGFWPTMALVILAAVGGSWLMRRQGAAALADLQGAFREFRDPTAPLAHGALILLAGALMVTPGFFSDILGILLLIPPVRRWVIRQIGARLSVVRVGFGTAQEFRSGPDARADDGIIDADYVVIDPKDPAPPTGLPSGWTRH